MTENSINKPIPPRLLIFLLGFCMFSTGASGLVNEYILATMSTYILGNSIEQFSIIIASMMLMMGLSGWVQQSISDTKLISSFINIEVLMAILGSFAPIAIYTAFGLLHDHFLIVHYFFILSIGFLIGFEIPIVMRIINSYAVDIKHNLKVVYAMDYIGAFVGAIIWVKYLLHNYPLTEISFIVSGFNFLIASLTIIYFFKKKLITHLSILLILAVTALLLIYGYQQNRDWNIYLEQKFYDDPIVESLTSKYQHLVLTENKKLADIRLYINGNTQFSSLDEVRYHELLVHPAMNLAKKIDNVLILGGGDGLALREVLKFKQVKQVTLVDLDPQMVQLASTNTHLIKLNQSAFADARVHTLVSDALTDIDVKSIYLSTQETDSVAEWAAQVDVYHIDADRFISQLHPQKWDVVIIDFPDPSSIELTKLYSREFYRKLKQIVNDDVVIAVQSTSPYHAKEAFITILNTIKSAGFKVLPYHQNVPSFGDWGYHLAWMNGVSVIEMKKQIKDISFFKTDSQYITAEVLNAALVFGKNELQSDHQCINTLMQPCLLNLYQNYSWLLD
ncbi:MAG: polyamine aminopropyltransferase [Pseudomonadota bacterium]